MLFIFGIHENARRQQSKMFENCTLLLQPAVGSPSATFLAPARLPPIADSQFRVAEEGEIPTSKYGARSRHMYLST